MADLSQTAANVHTHDGAATEQLTAGEAITAGMPYYRSTSDGKAYKALSDTAAHALARGIAMCDAAAGQPMVGAVSGPVDLGATLTVGEFYVVSSTAGAIAPESDLVADDYVTFLGVATAADKLALNIDRSGVQVPT